MARLDRDIQSSLYHFYYEFEDINLPQEKVEEFTKAVDENLKNLNMEYKAKRDSFRLKEPIGHALQLNAFDEFKSKSIAAGLGREGQFKMNLLLQDENRHAMFKELVRQ